MQREEKEQIFSKRVRAGKRTYFFDVRATKSNDYYLTITESRRQQRDGEFFYDKSKMFIYKEDFNKFVDALQETVDHIKSELNPDFDYEQFDQQEEETKPVEKTRPKLDTPIEDDEFGNSELSWE
ncbi:Protein of unknown function [Spirosomataceae bacterium TFI 002]|nr:Protein of unknown function [Spirosomataceae bacterium TFI 002]